ncbi:hypothetical protein [Janthinobacterium sp. S3M3]|uniref:hypothetical protein n=1 Tax=Janthinobacterium sp. S3M3 TaxID=2723078 RepID=UPI00160DD417|nr:hypothetical protein [Janthinobacterium sp. S3M3]MBB5606102.1 hypothetical protein [Janthinobacterium sp. S3T4]
MKNHVTLAADNARQGLSALRFFCLNKPTPRAMRGRDDQVIIRSILPVVIFAALPLG